MHAVYKTPPIYKGLLVSLETIWFVVKLHVYLMNAEEIFTHFTYSYKFFFKNTCGLLKIILFFMNQPFNEQKETYKHCFRKIIY